MAARQGIADDCFKSEIPSYHQFAGSGLLLAYHLGQFKAYENRFIHITQADTVESVADSQSFTESIL